MFDINSLDSTKDYLFNLVNEVYIFDDPAHDFSHINRVVNTALKICSEIPEAKWQVVLPAACFHDVVNFPKNHELRSKASQYSATKALDILSSVSYPEIYFDKIKEAIIGHSFSAGVTVNSIEAKIVQDADRLDGIGAIGVARCFATASKMNSEFYSLNDPLGENRELNDKKFSLDHFYKKLFKLSDMMHTQQAKDIAKSRVDFMKSFVKQFLTEI